MKAIWIENGAVARTTLNEACSSGCGSFLSGVAHSLHVPLREFGEAALRSRRPVDLGTKCTVFMSSRVKHAQKAGASLEDLSAGVAYAVARTAIDRVIGPEGVNARGGRVVVQGGAFMSDGVLRAFELLSGAEAIRPDVADLMGAVGAALIARERGLEYRLESDEDSPGFSMLVRSSIVGADELASLRPERRSVRCPGCQKSCLVSIVDLGDGSVFVSGNRCERTSLRLGGAGAAEKSVRPPNVLALKQGLLRRFGSLFQEGERGSVAVGLTATLHQYDKLPFWHTLFTSLGFSTIVPKAVVAEASYRDGTETIPSESVCHPAKISHRRLDALFEAGADAVFMPRYERGRRCPVACGYPSALLGNTPRLRSGEVRFLSPLIRSIEVGDMVKHNADKRALLECIRSITPMAARLCEEEFERALATALEAQIRFEETVACGNRRALAWAHEPGRRGAVVSCRPYHVDPEVLHSVDRVLQSLGFAVISASDLDPRGGSQVESVELGDKPWSRAGRLRECASFVAADPSLELVLIRSFGCGFDSLNSLEVEGALAAMGRYCTVLKIDEMIDVAHVRIRLRTLAEALAQKERAAAKAADKGMERTCGLLGGFGGAERAIDVRLVQLAGRGDLLAFSDLSQDDYDAVRRYADDLCCVSAMIAGRVVRLFKADLRLTRICAPRACVGCVLEGIPAIVERACGARLDIAWEDSWPATRCSRGNSSRRANPVEPAGKDCLRVGIVGAPPLCFDSSMNDDIVGFIESQGCSAVLPELENMLVDDARYLRQMDKHAEDGVDRVIYLQSFGCLKGHVQARGALREYEQRYPGMPVTIIDCDPQASALNRENRLRLALSVDEGDVGLEGKETDA